MASKGGRSSPKSPTPKSPTLCVNPSQTCNSLINSQENQDSTHLKSILSCPPPLFSRGSSNSLHGSSATLGPPGSPSRKNSNVHESKIVVLGPAAVGKSALVVRLLTGRFIWEYDPTLEATYRHHTSVDDEPAVMEILDTAGLVEGVPNESHIKWAEGFLVVYSLTDRVSFHAVPGIFSSIASLKQSQTFPCVLVANKLDLTHQAQVCEDEAEAQANSLGVALFLTSACDGGPEIASAFSELHRDITRRSFVRPRRSSAKSVIEGLYKMFSR